MKHSLITDAAALVLISYHVLSLFLMKGVPKPFKTLQLYSCSFHKVQCRHDFTEVTQKYNHLAF